MNIEKNIPLPQRKKRPTKWDFLPSLNVGDSFTVKVLSTAGSTKSVVSRAKGELCPEFKLAFHEEGDMVRVWRKA
jgi:hypothetical protein